jgi:hypothetical protein
MKAIITVLGWVPGLGTALKLYYIGGRAKEALSKVKVEDPDKLKSETAGEYLKDIADDVYEENIAPEVSSLGLPDFLATKAKEKAMDVIVDGLKKKYLRS